MNLPQAIKIVSDFQRNSGMEIHNIPISIDDYFVGMIVKHLGIKGKKIRVVDISTSSKVLSGYYRHFEDKIDIGVRDNLNPCWTRFVTCKELSHLLLGHNGAGITGSPRDLVNGLYSIMLFGNDEVIDHENLAQVCAAEIMMPYEISQPLLEDKLVTSLDIAQKFKIPLGIVQVYRSDSTLSTRKEIYESLKK